MPEDKQNTSEQTNNNKTQDSSWQYKEEVNKTSARPDASSYVQPISWEAPEYVHNHKSPAWFIMAMLAAVGLAAIVLLVTSDWISAIVILVIGISFAAFAARKPKTLKYSVDGMGVHIGQKAYPYDHYGSFSLLEDEPTPTILLKPIRRFGLPLHLHFNEADADKILDVIGSHLPGEQSAAPPVDRLMTKIRF